MLNIKEVIFIGAGGHSSVLYEILTVDDFIIRGAIAETISPFFMSKNISKLTDKDLNDNEHLNLVNGIGFMPKSSKRKDIYLAYKEKGYTFQTVISDSSFVSDYAQLSEGVQVLNSSIINANANIGHNTIINTNALIEHDVSIGKNCHIAPGAIICGNASIGNNVFIGAGAIIIQDTKIGDNKIIGAGAVVKKDLI